MLPDRPVLLSINNYFYRRSGAEVVFFNHNKLFEKNGWAVVPFAMRHPENIESEYSPYFVDEIEYGKTYSAFGNLARASKVIYSFEAKRKLRSLLERSSPRVAHCHCIYHHISPSILGTLKSFGIPTVMTLHDLKIGCPAYFMNREAEPCRACRDGQLHNVVRYRCIKGSLALSLTVFAESTLHRMIGSYTDKVDAFVSPSRFYIDELQNWGFARQRFHYVPNFIDVSHVAVKGRPGKGFAYVGRLSAEKGVITLVRASALSGQPVMIVGDGPERAELEKAAAALSAPVTFTGAVDHGKVFGVMAESRATVLPSVWYENAPMAVLESFATGTPAIGADIGGIPELIEPGVDGELFPPSSAEDLAEVLRKVAALPDQAVREMGQNGRTKVENNFNYGRYFESMSALYRNLET